MACQRSTSLRLCACRLGRAQSSEAGDAGAPPRQPQPALPLIPAPAPAPSRRLQPLPRSAGRWRSRHTVAVGGVASARAHLVGEERHGIALLVLRRLRRPERRQQHQRDESQRRPQTPRRHVLDCPVGNTQRNNGNTISFESERIASHGGRRGCLPGTSAPRRGPRGVWGDGAECEVMARSVGLSRSRRAARAPALSRPSWRARC